MSESSILQSLKKTSRQFLWMVALVYCVPFWPEKCLLCLKCNMIKRSEISNTSTPLLQGQCLSGHSFNWELSFEPMSWHNRGSCLSFLTASLQPAWRTRGLTQLRFLEGNCTTLLRLPLAMPGWVSHGCASPPAPGWRMLFGAAAVLAG